MGKWDQFNKAISPDVAKDIDKVSKENGTGDYAEVPKGTYIGQVVKFEVGECGPNAKTPGAPLLKLDFKITEGDYKKHHLFMNKVLYTDRNDDKWNITKLMGGVVAWINKLQPSEDIEVVFKNYDQFSDLILDIAEDIAELYYQITYDPDDFYNIHVDDVFEE